MYIWLRIPTPPSMVPNPWLHKYLLAHAFVFTVYHAAGSLTGFSPWPLQNGTTWSWRRRSSCSSWRRAKAKEKTKEKAKEKDFTNDGHLAVDGSCG